MAVRIRNNANNGWINIANIRIRNNSNGWNLVKTGKIWTGSAWSKFYQRITTTAPTVSATTVTTNAITWTITQASTTQFTEFPSQFQYYTVRPNGTRNPLTGYSYTDARVAFISLTGLSQNQTASIYYRLMYEDDTAGDNSDNTYYPENETYILKETTTDSVTVENPTVTGAGSTAPNKVSFTVDYHSADNFDWALTRNSDGDPVSSATNVTNGTLTNLTVPYQNTQYKLAVTANYETDFSPDETTVGVGYEISDAVVAVAPTVTGTALNSFQIRWDIDLNGASYAYYQLIKDSDGSYVGGSGTLLATGSITSSSLFSNTRYRLKVDGVFNGYGASVTATTTAYARTEVFVPTAPSITFNLRGYNFIDWTITSGATIEWRVGTTSLGSQTDSGYSQGGLNVFVAVPISAAATTYYISARAYASGGEVSDWATASANKVSFTNPSVTFNSQSNTPYGKYLTWNINNGSGTDISYDLRRGSLSVASGTTSNSTYVFGPATTGFTYTLFYRSRISGILANPDFWAPTYAEGTYVNWPGVGRTVT